MMLLALAAAAALQSPPLEVTAVEEIVVVGARSLLTVVVEGDGDAATLVTSDPDIRCGLVRYQYEALGRPRLCWTRRERGETVVLSPQASGVHGRDWSVEWSGCATVDAAGRCTATMGETAGIRAVFRRPA